MSPSINLFEKIVRLTSGFLIGLLIIILLLKFFNSMLGPIIGIILNAGFYYYSKQKRGKDQKLMLVALGALVSAIFSFAVGIILWTTISALFAGVAA